MLVGVVVNPVAGIGGRVGLKGTDGRVQEARERGAQPRAQERVQEALVALCVAAPNAEVAAPRGAMGERAARAAGFDPYLVEAGGELYETDAADTRAAVRELVARNVDLILFVGGDGTAADVADTLDEDTDVPVLGVPAGVKVYSSVFARTPRAAGRTAAGFERVEEREVADIDEDAYRDGELRASVRGVVSVPTGSVQESKSRVEGDIEGLARGFADDVRDDTTYVFGTGGTVAAVERELGVEPSPPRRRRMA